MIMIRRYGHVLLISQYWLLRVNIHSKSLESLDHRAPWLGLNKYPFPSDISFYKFTFGLTYHFPNLNYIHESSVETLVLTAALSIYTWITKTSSGAHHCYRNHIAYLICKFATSQARWSYHSNRQEHMNHHLPAGRSVPAGKCQATNNIL